MPYKLKYKFQPGDQLIYQQEITAVFTTPDGRTTGGRLESQMLQSIENILPDDGAWTITLTQTILHQEGLLKDPSITEPHPSQVTFSMTEQGAITKLQAEHQDTPLITISSFPTRSVEVGEIWQTQPSKTSIGVPLEILWKLEKIEAKHRSTLAHLISYHQIQSNKAVHPDSETQSSVLFNITYGHQEKTTAVTTTTWDDGRILRTLVELTLTRRTPTPTRN